MKIDDVKVGDEYAYGSSSYSIRAGQGVRVRAVAIEKAPEIAWRPHSRLIRKVRVERLGDAPAYGPLASAPEALVKAGDLEPWVDYGPQQAACKRINDAADEAAARIEDRFPTLGEQGRAWAVATHARITDADPVAAIVITIRSSDPADFQKLVDALKEDA